MGKLTRWLYPLLAVAALAVALFDAPFAHAIIPSSHPLLRSGTVTCATTATPIPATSTTGRQRVIIYNADAASIFVGDKNVTSSGAGKGLTVVTNSYLPIPLDVGYGSGDTTTSGTGAVGNIGGGVYCISVAGAAANTVSWLESR